MISPYDILTSSGKYPDRPLFSNKEIRENASELSRRVSVLMQDYIKLCVSSGFRTLEANQAAGGAKSSNHLKGLAVDIHDLGHYLLRDYEQKKEESLLVKHDLYLEHPDHTRTWTHLQITPPRSGNRVFVP